MARRRLVSVDEAVPTLRQHVTPCSDCPWRRDALPGWLGSMTPLQWVQSAHGEDRILCHALLGPQCAGAAIYRANVCKRPRDPEAMLLLPDKKQVFANPREFLEYHATLPSATWGEDDDADDR